MEEDCLFCKIIKREVPADIVYEDDKVIAFKDIHPVAPVHILVIPKEHISGMNNIDENNSKCIANVYESIKKVAKICNIDESGYRVICNQGKDGGQVVFHIHFHLLGGRALGSKVAH